MVVFVCILFTMTCIFLIYELILRYDAFSTVSALYLERSHIDFY